MDSKKAPWHSDHAKVNKSCAGCHKGNPRLMRETMAHNRMISDPRDKLQQACSTCHAGDDLDTLSKPYISLREES
jgi:formate-dependent nitrite reductase cytochrome c552 subunit